MERLLDKHIPALDISSPIDLGFLEDILRHIYALGLLAYRVQNCVLEVIGLDNEGIRELNANFRGKDMPTDVLSFPLVCDMYSTDLAHNSAPICLGSIVINYEMAQDVAKRLQHSLRDELSLLFVHGFLHILGYDHEVDNGEQRALEQSIIESLGLAKSLIVRAEG